MKTLLLIVSLVAMAAMAQDTPSTDTFDVKGHKDWGSYYDPKSIFCGQFDCYKILGFDYEDFGKSPPDTKVITKRYRSMSRYWHPDKNRDKGAKEKFVKIARAYEVLTNNDTRTEYDMMRYNQEAYFQKYGSSVMWKYAPKSDASMVVIVILVFGSVLSWFIQKQHWQNIADRLIRASVEDLGPREGGTPESKEIRARALKILEEREKESKNEDVKDESRKKKKKVKMTASEKRKQLEDSLHPIVTELVEEIDDFGAGYHKPTWKDLLVVKIGQMPVAAGKAIVWNTKYMVNRIRGLELNDDEREVLTRRAVGEINWVSASEEERAKMVKLDLWVADNMVEWEEQQELKQLSASDQKKFNRLKKKGKSGKVEDWKTD